MSTFAELQVEFFARGFSYLNEDTAGRTRAKAWLNLAYAELSEMYPWPWLETTTTGTGTVVLTNAKQILSVTNTDLDRKLPLLDIRSLSNAAPDLTTTGTPAAAYLDGETITLYPVSSTTNLSVRYQKYPTALSADGDTPLGPTRFHYLIVSGAVIHAYEDTDNWDAAERAQNFHDRRVQNLAWSQLHRNYANADSIDLVAGSYDDAYQF